VLAVGTGGGRLVAGSGDGAHLVAVVAARVAAGGVAPCEVAVSHVSVGRERFVVSAVGHALDEEIAAGVRRILQRSCSSARTSASS